ncbi:TetR/AcrR family transcriptional regulator [Kitasatospora phosalacinea]|uniref:TetR/AcrR family transcriptional regulator n=1 Tax=Kitasatospora phosalacinea TaxID=2065 RepID=A0ABW6GJJ7_9ACTN
MATRRPPNRKEMIRETAAALFVERGYRNVSVTDVARALDISPSALYHHYRNKQDLLLQTVLDGLGQVDARVKAADSLDAALQSLAQFVVGGPRGLLAVWDREARHLDGEARATITAAEAGIVADFLPLLNAARPGLDSDDASLVAAAVFGALGSQSSHRLSVSRRRDEQITHRFGTVLAHCPLPPRPPRAPAAPDTGTLPLPGLRRSRRDQILAEAIRLFDEHGYQSVTMADIGSAVGIVASGVYRHFAGKTDILVAAANRGGERIRTATEEAVTGARDPRDALDRLLRAHIAVALDQAHLVALLAHERDQLPDKERTDLRRFQVDYLALWVAALDAVAPGRSTTELKMIVHAVHAMVSFVVRSPRVRRQNGLEEPLQVLGTALLLAE